MKKNKKKWTGLMAVALAVTCVAGGTVLAAGDKNDPLVTLSYLEETVLPAILKQAEKTADSKKSHVENRNNEKYDFCSLDNRFVLNKMIPLADINNTVGGISRR